MAQRVYATAADYYDFIGGDLPMTDPPAPAEGEEPVEPEPIDDADLNARLRRASATIDGLTRRSVYDVDEDGYPTDQDIADAFRDMTCAQVAWWDDTDDVTGAGSQAGTFSIGSVSIGAAGRTTGNGAPNAAASRISPEAVEIGVNAGLITAVTAHL